MESTQENRRRQLLVKIDSNISLDNELNIQDLNLSDNESDSPSNKYKRDITQLNDEDDEMNTTDNSVEYHPKWSCQRNDNSKNKRQQRPRNFLTVPELFEYAPMDFTSDWFAVCLPQGVRCCVTSSKGTTLSRTQEGKFLSEFQSLLPGGSKLAHGGFRKSEFCILDCIFDSITSTYHIIDVMCFNGHPVTSCETEFRHFWIQSKITDFHPKYKNELRIQSNLLNPASDFYFPQSADPKLRYRFSMLPIINCTQENLNQLYSTIDEHKLNHSIQGLYFIHKKSPYLRGSSPLSLYLPTVQFTQDWIQMMSS